MTLVLKDEIDISRGDLLLDAEESSLPCKARRWTWCGWRSNR